MWERFEDFEDEIKVSLEGEAREWNNGKAYQLVSTSVYVKWEVPHAKTD